ncbi:ThuA domain-containing protein [Chitinophaga sp. GCM10012297]|uniref:ThuA domain-containing protein n=1 Tax=Chitinophaga chungangae TaxID=2821488 RepID=A0ABS3YAR9_9BACT|nr:ThuA domain-containing protein [Chitinophaga chungangae]MBO9151770.1 ThuA domain-containing protein [Chitinophaga chungangae]
MQFSRHLVISLLLGVSVHTSSAQQPKILVFSKTEGGYRHTSIEAGKIMFINTAKQYGIAADTTEDATWFTPAKLSQYKTLVFLSTRGNVLDSTQQLALMDYIHTGGGFVGIHAATTTEYEWPWYNRLAGAWFDGHPEPQQALYRVTDKNFPATNHLPDTFRHYDEVYNFKSVQDSLHYLITVEENSYSGGKMGSPHPVCWYREFEGGRSFYIGLGHFEKDYEDPFFLSIVWKGIQWAMQLK